MQDINNIKKHFEVLLKASKDFGLDINAEIIIGTCPLNRLQDKVTGKNYQQIV
jgi:hypothetical protein